MRNRDDFSEATKRNAAKRVGYRCSMCGCITEGPSYISSSSTTSIGVASHICAAAPGGPRYNPKMNPEERKGIENCIWMCQTHSRLIDNDENTYTVEKLKEMKNRAEKKAHMELENGRVSIDMLSENEEISVIFAQHFEDLLIDGEYTKLINLLNSINEFASENLKEVFLRYRVIYDCYCKRDSLLSDLSSYLNLKSILGLDILLGHFIILHLKEALSLSIGFSKNTNLIDMAKVIIDNSIFESWFVTDKENKEITIPETLIHIFKKSISYFIFKEEMLFINNSKGELFTFENDNYFFHLLDNIRKLAIYYNCNNPIKEKEIFHIVLSEINNDKTKQLDKSLQLMLWQHVMPQLIFNKDQYSKIYGYCPDDFKLDNQMKKYNYFYLIYKKEVFDIDEFIQFVENTKDYSILDYYLTTLNNDDCNDFLEERNYLYRKSSIFIYRKYKSLEQENKKEIMKIIDKYKSFYEENDFIINCILANELNDNEHYLKIITDKKNISFPLSISFFYIKILQDNKKWEELVNFSNSIKEHPTILLQLANALLSSQISKYMLKAEIILENLHLINYLDEMFYITIGNLKQKIGKYEEALNYFKQGYDIFKSEQSLYNFLSLRFEQKLFNEDFYLIEAKKIKNVYVTHLVGCFYMKLKNYSEAYKFFMRSLLIKEDFEHSIAALNHMYMHELITSYETNNVNENTIIHIMCDEDNKTIAIHKDEILEDIVPNNFANCIHYSIDNPIISEYMFCKVNDEISYNDKKYKIKKIESIHHFMASYCLKLFASYPSTIQLNFDDIGEVIPKMEEILRKQKETMEENVNLYNANKFMPLEILKNLLGLNIMRSWEFLLHDNKEKIANNCTSVDFSENSMYILSYDSILTLGYLGLWQVKTMNNVYIPIQIKLNLLDEIEEEIHKLKISNSPGVLIYQDEKMMFVEDTDERKRTRLQYLTSMKSFINSMNVKEAYDFTSSNNNYTELFKDNTFSELSPISLAKNIPNSIVVTDNCFLYGIANAENTPNTGVCYFLSKILYDWKEILNAAINLSKANFLNYIPFEMYEIMMVNFHNQKGTSEDLLTIKNWLYPTKDKDNKFHYFNVKTIFEKTIDSGNSYLNPNHFLLDVALQHIEHLQPGLANKIFENAIKSLSVDDDITVSNKENLVE